jgi:hypothetical protein
MMHRTAFALVLLPALLLGGLAWGGSPAAHPVVVELFTSQGCSDCPPADKIVAELAGRRDVIALSLPITYWDMLGWKDTLATEANTQRQKAYAKAMSKSGVYTPQLIIGGTEDVVGNQRDKVLAAIAAHAAQDASARHVSMAVTPAGDHVTIAISGERPRRDVYATIWLMRTLSHVSVAVGGGENANRDLAYSNVVRDLQRVGSWYGGPQTVTLPISLEPGKHDGFAVILQNQEYGRVIAASFIGPQKSEPGH